MARYLFGGGSDDYAVDENGRPIENRRLRFYTSAARTTEVTDLASDASGTGSPLTVTTDGNGYWPEVYGPDGVVKLYVGAENASGQAPSVVVAVYTHSDSPLHTHAESDVTNLSADLAAKASTASLTSHTGNTSNPHSVTAAQVGALTPAAAAATYVAALTVVGYGVKADGRHMTDAAITAGTAAVTSATAAFTQADVGKVAILERAGTTLSTTLSSGLTSGANTGSLPVAALGQDWSAGIVTVTSGGNSKGFYTTGASAGATSLPIVSDKPDFSYPSGSTVSLAPTTLVTTIQSVQSSTAATLAANAGTTLAAQADPTGSGHPPSFWVVSDDTAAWTAVAAAVPSGGSALVVAPPGISYTSTAVSFADRVNLVGGGGGGRRYNLTRLLSSVSSGAALTCNKSGSRIADIAVEYVGSTVPSSVGIKWANGYYNRLTDVTVSGFATDFQVITGSEWHATRCTFYNPVTYGADIGNADNPDEGDMAFVDCKFVCRDYSPTAAVRQPTGGGMRFLNNKVNNDWRMTPSNGVWAKDMQWQHGYYAPMTATTSDLLINNCSIENYYGNGVYMTVATTKTFTNVGIRNVEFLSFQRGANNAQEVVLSATDSGALRNVSIDGLMMNMSGGTAQGAVSIANANGVSVGPGIVNSGFPWLTTLTSCTNVVDVTRRGFGFPCTVDPGMGVSASYQAWTSANRAYWWRVRDGGTISQIVMNVGTASGNISLTTNLGTPGRTGPSTASIVSGAIACPAAGDATVSLGSSFTMLSGDWFGMSCDNTTATFRGIAPGLGIEAWMQGLVAYKDTAHPLGSGAPASTSWRYDRVYVLVGA